MTGFVFLDKEEGITSFIAAKRLGRIFETKKVGHTGTLDPMATGVMVIAMGYATRFIELIDNHDKAYRARFVLGKTTDTLDITGKILSENNVTVTKDEVEKAVLSFKGDSMQLPPMYSAIKKDGVRLYDLARQGIEIEREKRAVTISHIAVTDSDEKINEYEIEVHCSKGTYIRSLISDIGEKLGTGAVMTSLRRIKANGVFIDKCFTLSELERMKEEGTLSSALNKVDSFISYPPLKISEAQAKRFSNGGSLDINRFGGKKDPGFHNVYSPSGVFLGIGEIDEEKEELKVKRVFIGQEDRGMFSSVKREKGTAVALGYFDGIHTGHQAVLGTALEKAKEKDLVPVVMLFDIHPRKLLTGTVPPMLVSEERKRELLKKMGFEIFDFDFHKAMNYTPAEFEQKVLIEELNAKVVSCGYDYRYGKGGKGNSSMLKNELSSMGAEVFELSPVYLDGETVSSTKIRQLISEGEIEKANRMLGSFFTYDFPVIKGDGLGHTLGFPTINQTFPEDFIVPLYGVYASRVKIDGKYYSSVTNIGVRPTVSGENMRSETCIFDFSDNLYGKTVEVSLIKFLREEKKFDSLEELKEAVAKDIVKSKEVYKEVMKYE